MESDPLGGVAVFVAVVETSSFTVAAQRLRLTKSGVSKSIARLEARLGCTLIHRTTRKVQLTPEGEAYYQACAGALEQVASAEADLSTRATDLTGHIQIDMPASFGRRVLLPILAEIAEHHPDLSFRLTFSDATSDLLQDGLDLAIRFGTLADTSQLVARHLARQHRVICASPGYFARHGTPQALKDIRHHRCVVGVPKGPPLTWVVAVGGRERRLTPPPTHELSDGEALVDAALAGMGLIQLPAFMVRHELAAGRLVSVLEGFSSADIDIHAVWPRRAQRNPKVRHVVDHLVAKAAQGRMS